MVRADHDFAAEKGNWSYFVVANRGVAIRPMPTFAFPEGTKEGPKQNEKCKVSARLKVGRTAFLKLADGTGWIFDTNREGRLVCREEGTV